MGQVAVKEVDERALGEVDWLVELGSVVAFLLFIWCTLISTALSLVCSTIITYLELPTICKKVHPWPMVMPSGTVVSIV